MKLLIHGKDSVRATMLLQQEVRKISGSSEIALLDFAETSFGMTEILQSFESGLFAVSKSIIFKNFSESDIIENEKAVEMIFERLKNTGFDVIFFETVDLSKARKKIHKSFYTKLKTVLDERKLDLLDNREITQRVVQYAKGLRVSIDRQTANLLVELSGEDYISSINNIRTIAAFLGYNGIVTESEVRKIYDSEILDPWAFPNTLLGKNKAQKLKLLEKILESVKDKGELNVVFGQIVYEVRAFYRYLIGKETGNLNEMKVSYFKQKIYQNIRGPDSNEILELMNFMAEMDRDVKVGKIQIDDAIRMIIMKI